MAVFTASSMLPSLSPATAGWVRKHKAIEMRTEGSRIGTRGEIPQPFGCGREGISSPGGRGGAADQAFADFRRDKRFEVAAQRRNLTQQGAADVRQLLMGHQEDRFDVGIHHGVHDRHGELVLHVAGGANAEQHDVSAEAADEANGQAVEGEHLDVAIGLDRMLEQLDALALGEELRVFRVVADGDDEPIDKPSAALDDVEMPEVDRIEDAGIDRDAFGGDHGCHRRLVKKLFENNVLISKAGAMLSGLLRWA